ncbi:hypothetical protein [Halostagnicola sp. A-GB9-2]|uniref:hypothetical protein n=1 Tax=Halostagnicola sp. A-GB9-2 TaxID=3048066 RepID=UPI0024BFEA73|nr:hypothetical protein [Halostagnicola sp. A-GB9-2]MDJ1430580.1 hypothetical protein [Halostagnicola sp. A-GB9-2]
MTIKQPVGSLKDAGPTASLKLVGRWLLLLGTPIALAAVLWFHPAAGEEVYSNLEPVADTWFYIHILLLPLFGLLGVVLYVLLAGYRGTTATIGRIGIAGYLVCYIAFESIAGIATGILLRESQNLSTEQQEGVEAVLQVIFTEPINGVVGVLALLGTIGILLAVVAIGVVLRRSGAPLVPLVLLGGAPIAIVAHGSGLADVIGMVLFATGVAWLEFGWTSTDETEFKQGN